MEEKLRSRRGWVSPLMVYFAEIILFIEAILYLDRTMEGGTSLEFGPKVTPVGLFPVLSLGTT